MGRHLLACLIITLALFLCLGASLHTPFLFLDDYYHLLAIQKEDYPPNSFLLNTYSTEQFSLEELKGFMPWWLEPSSFKFHYFRPLSSYSLKLDHILWEKQSFGFHLTNLALHVGCTLLMYALAVSLGASRRLGVLIALIGGLHPNNIFNVTWISCRDILLSFFFFLLCCLSFNRFLRAAANRPLLWGASFLFYLLGLFSKEIVFFTPFVLFGMAALSQCLTEPHALGRGFRRSFLQVLPFFLSSLAYLGWYFLTGHGVKVGYVTVSSEQTLSSNLLVLGTSFLTHVVSLVLYLPPEFSQRGTSLLVIVLGAGILLTLGGLLFGKGNVLKQQPVLWFSLFWVLIFMAPALCFVPMGRLLYFSVFGYGLFVGTGLDLIRRSIRGPRRRKLLWGFFLFYFLAIPAFSNMFFIPSLNEKARATAEDFDRGLRDFIAENRETREIFLLNAPNLATSFTVQLMFPCNHPDLPQRIHVLSNDVQVPQVEVVDQRTLFVHNPEGVIQTGLQGFQTRHLQEGSRHSAIPFEAEIIKVDEAKITAVVFKFRKPVHDADYAFVRVVGKTMARVKLETDS